jgi:hypothetical protein
MSSLVVFVPLEGDVVAQLDALALELGTTRSELINRGLQLVLEAEQAADELRLIKSAARLAAETAPPW